MAFLRNEKGQIIRKDGSVVENTMKGRPKGPRKTVIDGAGRVSHMKVDMILGGDTELRAEYEKLLCNPNTLIKDLQAWFAARGHHVNKTAIGRHRKRYLEAYQDVRDAAKMASAFTELVRRDGGDVSPGMFVEASQGRFEMLLMKYMMAMKHDKCTDPAEWNQWSKTLENVAKTRRGVENMRIEFREKAEQAAKAVEEGVKGGASGKDVVERMREILGV